MKLIAGLGNPGEKYENTRHNIGFKIIEAFINSSPELSKLKENNKLKSFISINHGIILAEPMTYMNKSGEAIDKIATYYKIDWNDPENLFIEIQDDLDLPFGQFKIQKGKGAAGHKGVESTMEVINPEIIWRIRVGIAGKTKNSMPGDAYVLSQFTKEEETELPTIITRAVSALNKCIKDSPGAAAQEYNQKTVKDV
jgi:PTH1 family peptidyl-tRNA hydrolase